MKFIFGIIFITSLSLMFIFWNGTHHKTLIIPMHSNLKLEIAKTSAERARGLMFRKNLNEHQGMLFVFPNQGPHAFWMKNTLIPLDMIWLNNKNKIVYHQDQAPPCHETNCPLYQPPSSIKARYVIEIKSGLREKLKLVDGQTLNF